jgi:hypothetical protein
MKPKGTVPVFPGVLGLSLLLAEAEDIQWKEY